MLMLVSSQQLRCPTQLVSGQPAVLMIRVACSSNKVLAAPSSASVSKNGLNLVVLAPSIIREDWLRTWTHRTMVGTEERHMEHRMDGTQPLRQLQAVGDGTGCTNHWEWTYPPRSQFPALGLRKTKVSGAKHNIVSNSKLYVTPTSISILFHLLRSPM